MRVTGLNLSDSSMEAVELTKGWFGRGRFTRQQRVDLPEGLVENGVIHDVPKLAQALRSGISGDLIVALPESQVYSRWLRFPSTTKPAQVKQTIQEHCAEYIPFEQADVVLEYIFAGTTGEQRDVLLLAVPKTILAGYQGLAKALGCRLKRLELESLSSARAALEQLPINGATLLLDVGARTSIASWFTHSGLRFTFNVPVAGQAFSEHIQRSLKLTANMAEQTKRRLGFSGKTKDSLAEAWQPIVQAVRDGVQYLETEAQLATTAVVLIGGSAQLPQVTDWLSQQWQIPVRLPAALPWQTKYGTLDKVMLNAVGLVLGELDAYRHWPTVNFSNTL